MARCPPASGDFRERASVGCNSFRNSLAVDELPFAAAGDEFGLTEDLEVVRDGRRGHSAHRDDLATGHVAGRRHGLKDFKPRLVRQGFRYFLNLGTRHARSLKCSEVVGPAATESGAEMISENLHPIT